MEGYPKWYNTAELSPMRLIHEEIDAIRARLDAAGIAKVCMVPETGETCDGSGSERWGASDWTAAAGEGLDYPSAPDVAGDTKFEAGDKVHFADNLSGDLFTIKGDKEYDGKTFWTLEETAGEFAGDTLVKADKLEVKHDKVDALPLT